MNTNEMTFGIEIECAMPNTRPLSVGGRHRGHQVAGLPQGWNAQADCSIQAPRGYYGVEIVSPILKGNDGAAQVATVCATLNEWGAKVNQSTGLHVHVGFAYDNKDALERLAYLVANFEVALFAATGTHARESSHYCKSIRADYRSLTWNQSTSRLGATAMDRYHTLNLSNLITGEKPTVEFRMFAGTTNATKILGYARLCLGLVQRAHEAQRRTNWEAKSPVATSPIHRSGIGQTEMCRLFYQLGWTKGRTNTVYGGIEAPNAPTIADCKKELMRLAAKYDAAR